MDTNIITYLACICFLFIFGRIFIVPIKKILKLIINSILGGLTIFLINLVGGIWSTRTARGSMSSNSKIINLKKGL